MLKILSVLLLVLPFAASAQPVYQPIETRQICGERLILHAPAGQVIAQADEGTQVTVRDFGIGPNGRGYYRIDLRDGYVAMEDAPHFCIRPNEGVNRAPPNTCHLVVASRRTLPEVNEVARQYSAYLPTMSAYRASNGWYAVSLGLVTQAAVGPLLENAEGLPSDSYCSDGMNYIGAMDLRDGVFSDPQGSADAPCLLGDAGACTARAEEIIARSDRSKDDTFEAMRFWLLGCMAGDYQACGRPEVLVPAYYDHALLTALPDADYRLGMMRDLSRTACDAGSAEGCMELADREMQLHADTPPEYFAALQASTAGCMAGNIYTCRDMFLLLDRRAKVMDTPVSAETWYHAAGLSADTCRHDPMAGGEYSCRPVYRAYAAFAEMAAPDDPRVSQARAYLRSACEGGNSDACPPIDPMDEFREIARQCQTLNTPEGEEACSEVLSYYVRTISTTDLGALEGVLQSACTQDHIAGCETLAFLYSPYTITGLGLHFTGTDQPDRRLAALQTGCRPGFMGLPNCRDLAEMYEARDQQQQAADTYRMACQTIREDSVAALYVRGHDACFKAGLQALRKLDDRTAARDYFAFVCNAPRQSDARYACKHLGLLTQDARTAFDLFRQACYPAQEERGDGEGCLLYGNALQDNRDRISFGFEGDLPAIGTAPADAYGRRMADRLASRAYAAGCISKWEPSCAANRLLVARALDAPDAAEDVPCRIRSDTLAILADRTCKHVRFFETAEIEYGDRELVTTDVYIWPDGDRSLVQERAGDWRLNGAFADPYADGDETQCLRSYETGNSLCVKFPYF